MGSYGWTGTEIAADWAYDTYFPQKTFSVKSFSKVFV